MASWQETFAELKNQYVQRSTDRLAQIIDLAAKFAANPVNKDFAQQLSRHFHWLAGSGSMYGFQKVSALGLEGEKLAEQIVKQAGPPSSADLERLKLILNELSGQFSSSDELVQTGNLGKVRTVSTSGRREVLLVGEEQKDLQGLRRLLEESNITLRQVRTGNGALTEVEKRMPEGFLLEVPLPDGDSYKLLEKIRSLPGGDEANIVIISKQMPFIDKVRSINSGADAYFERPFDLQAMARRIKYLLDKRSQETPRILSVEDDPDQAAFIRAFLESAGYQVRTCTDPRNFESYVSAFQPDLILLDVMLPGINGYELARYLRQEERHATLPIIFLTTQGQIEAHIESARSGGNDHLVKPVPPALLLGTVASHLERARYLRTLLHRDGLTDLLNQSSFMEMAQSTLAYRKRHPGRSALIVLDLDYFRSINERHGYPAGDKVLVALSLLLKRSLRQSDTVGRISGDGIAILAEGLSEGEALALATRILTEFASIQHSTLSHAGFYATCSAGIGVLEPQTMALENWMDSALKALQEAKAAGRNCAQIHRRG